MKTTRRHSEKMEDIFLHDLSLNGHKKPLTCKLFQVVRWSPGFYAEPSHQAYKTGAQVV